MWELGPLDNATDHRNSKNEHQVPLHLKFVDFNAAFDNTWKGALWMMATSIGVDTKIASLIDA